MKPAARFAAPPDGRLDDAMLTAWHDDGFLMLEDFFSPADATALLARSAALIAAFDPERSRTVFSTRDQAHGRDRYFSESGDKIRCFLEAEAVDADGRLLGDKAAAVNKIGHALHDLDPVFARFSRRPPLAQVARSLGCRRPLLLQSMVICKPPRIGGEVGWHQDACFLYTEPSSVTGFWFALEDATLENGCMTALAGAHRGPLRQRFRRDGEALVMRQLDATPWPDEVETALEAPRGTLVLLDGLLPHASAPNRSDRPRQAYALHVIDGTAHYPDDNWLRRDSLPLRGFDASPSGNPPA